MKSIFAQSIVFILFIGTFAAANAQFVEFQNSNSEKSQEQFRLGLGVSVMHLDYKETLDPPKKSTESGFLPGITGFLRRDFSGGWAIEGNGSFHFGDEDYDGSTMDGEPLLGKTNSKFFELAGLGAHRFQLDPTCDLEIRAGLALKFWRRELDKNYVEDYTRIAIPVEGELSFLVGDKNRLKFFAATDIMIGGRMDLDFYGASADFTLGNEIGYRFGAAFDAPLTNKLSLILSSYYEHFAFGISNSTILVYQGTINSILEPASKTNNFFFKLGVSIDLN